MLYLNLGAGFVTPENWVNVDLNPTNDNVVEADVLVGLPHIDNEFDYVLMNHVLQTFTYNEHETVLSEVKRVMKEGATLRVLVPDLKKAIDKYNAHNSDDLPVSYELEKTYSGRVFRYIFWHGETRSGFDAYSLKDLLQRQGFKSVHLGKFGECELDSRESESLIMTCKK